MKMLAKEVADDEEKEVRATQRATHRARRSTSQCAFRAQCTPLKDRAARCVLLHRDCISVVSRQARDKILQKISPPDDASQQPTRRRPREPTGRWWVDGGAKMLPRGGVGTPGEASGSGEAGSGSGGAR